MKSRKPKKTLRNPARATALFQQGITLHRQGDLAGAGRAYQAALRLAPDHAGAWNNLGLIHHQAGRLREAMTAYRRALAGDPGHGDARHNLANVLADLGRLAEAETEAHHLARTGDRRGPFLLASLAQRAGRHHEAVAGYRAILARHPGDLPAQVGLATALAQADGDDDEIEALFQTALAADDGFLPARVEYGRFLVRRHRYPAAIRILEPAAPHHVEAAALLGYSLLDLGEARRAMAWLARLEDCADPALASSAVGARNYDPEATGTDLCNAARRWSQRLPRPRRAERSRPGTTPVLRLGFLSPDLRDHPVGYFLRPLLAALDQQRFPAFCYHANTHEDQWSRELAGLARGWRQVGNLDDEGLAAAIRADDIHILIDLAGHTTGNRLAALRLQPAPVQVSWLGYQATTGMAEVAFRITDPVADPPGITDGQYSERLLRLDGPFFCFAPPSEAGPVAPLPAGHGTVTFVSTNTLRKCNHLALATWAAILKTVAGARLVFCCHQVNDPAVQERIRQTFAGHGVAPERIGFQERLPWEAYLSWLTTTGDILLDPFPLCGHTVTCQALWMGVPVVTLAGDRFGGRMGASILHHLGLSELVAETPEAYVAIAAALANDRERLAGFRAGLRQRLAASPLCDAAGFARRFQAALAEIWREAGGRLAATGQEDDPGPRCGVNGPSGRRGT